MKKHIIILIILSSSLVFVLHAQEETTYWDNGNLREISNFKDGDREGKSKSYYQNGQLKSTTSYKKGDLDGERKDYHKNGQLAYFANYKNGESIGESTEYDKNGKIKRVISYKNGNWYKSNNKERRLIQFNTFLIDDTKKEKIKKIVANHLSRIDLIIKTEKNSHYSYVFGLQEKIFDNKPVKSLTILLMKNNTILSEISYNIDFEFMHISEPNSLKGFTIKRVDETLELGFGRGACGYGYHEILFFRNKNKLIKGLLISPYGEAESEYTSKQIIAPPNNIIDQVWVKKSTGISEYKNNEYTEVNYFTNIEKYKFQNDSLVLMNPKPVNNYYYVTAKNGLNTRNSPYFSNDNIIEVLDYGTKVKVLNKTNFTHELWDGSKKIKGRWVQVEIKNNSENYTAYIFDGYLSKELVNINTAKEINVANGEWRWYYANQQLGELGFYKNGKKDGLWEWYFENGDLKATGTYKDGQPVGTRKWYYDSYNDRNLYCIGQYSNGKKDGEWKWYYSEDKLRNSIRFNKDTIVQYVVFDRHEKLLFKNKGSNTTKVIFEESYMFLDVFDLKIEDPNAYNISFNYGINIGKRKNNKAEGEWKIYSEYGNWYIREHYKDGLKSGKQERFNDNQINYSEYYKKGKKTGKHKKYYDNGQIERLSKFKNNLRTGKWKWYYKNGQVKSTKSYSNDNPDGKYVDYHENGKIKAKGNYNNGIRDGEWKEYYKNGKLKEITPYKNEKIHGDWSKYNLEGVLIERTLIQKGDFKNLHKTHFYTNGQIRSIGSSDNDSEFGKWKFFYSSGELKEIKNYKDGKKHGEWKKYYKNGQLKTQGQYIKGKRDGKFIWYKEDGKVNNAIAYKYNSQYVMGEWKYFDNGQLKSVELYQRDELVEWKYYYDNGQLKEVRQYYKNRRRTGEWKYYYKSGQLRKLAQYKDEIPYGEFKLYHENGQLYKTQVWKYYKKLMEVNSCFDAKGNVLDIGTLKNGNGTVKEYNASGELINIAEYIDGKKTEHNVSLDDVWNDSSELYSLASIVCEEETDKAKLDFAIKWIKRSIKLDEKYHNTDTYASLLYKTGKYKQALIIAEKAVKIAKKMNAKFCGARQKTIKLEE